MNGVKSTEPPKGVIQYESGKDVPEDRKKYWEQRRDIFSKFDEGIWMTDSAWFETTSELIASKIAEEIAVYAPKEREFIVDAFSGVGGNSIAFALSGRWKKVFAIEKDEATIECAKHNASLYGVEKQIQFMHGDAMQFINTRLKPYGRRSVIFASPPWGGPEYTDSDVFDLHQMRPYGLQELWDTFKPISLDLAMYLPRNSDLEQIAQLAKEGETYDVVHYALWGSSKAICFYSGALSPG